MPFDGIVISSLADELKNELLNSKIDKIYQPESDEIIIKFRNINNKDRKLIISVNSNYPYICLAEHRKSNPIKPPMFCMLLRKHLQGGKIVDVKQVDFERILVISVENYDELGNLSLKNLTIETMGKHSNIILIDTKSNIILDSIKRIPISISRQRQVLPGLEYILPPSQNKLDIFNIDFSNYINHLKKTPQNTSLYKALYKSFQGISPILAKDICTRAKIAVDTPIHSISTSDLQSIWTAFKNLKELIDTSNYSPNIVRNIDKGVLTDFSSIDLYMYDSLNFKKTYEDSISDIIYKFYHEKDKFERIRQKSMDLKKILNTRIDRLYNKIQKQKEELIIAKGAHKYKLLGELILANLHKINRGMDSIEVENYYDPNFEKIKIPLDIRLTPSENSQKYFKKYNKYKNALKEITKQINDTQVELEYLENVLINIENTDDLKNIEEIKEELIEQNILKRKRRKQKKSKDKTFNPNIYYSSDGYTIYAGKNNKQNDYLTLKLASRTDIWFHTKDIPGSHVIIKTNGSDVPPSTIIEAAEIAAYHSKGRLSSNVPVDYTNVKYVKKPSGAKPGMVIYDNFKTVYVTPIESKIKKAEAQNL